MYRQRPKTATSKNINVYHQIEIWGTNLEGITEQLKHSVNNLSDNIEDHSSSKVASRINWTWPLWTVNPSSLLSISNQTSTVTTVKVSISNKTVTVQRAQ